MKLSLEVEEDCLHCWLTELICNRIAADKAKRLDGIKILNAVVEALSDFYIANNAKRCVSRSDLHTLLDNHLDCSEAQVKQHRSLN